MARRFNNKNIVSWGISTKGATKEQCDELMLKMSAMGLVPVIRPEMLKESKNGN